MARKRPKALFILNSFSGGGAERVCFTCINELLEAHEVDVVVLYDTEDYRIEQRDGLRILRLGENPHASHTAKLASMAQSVHRLNAFTKERERSGRYCLVTAHLTASHILARLSRVGCRCLYVHHSLPTAVASHFSSHTKALFKWLYAVGGLVSVSNGVGRQLSALYGIRHERIVTIYNPMPVEEIARKALESVKFDRPYLLFVGRLNAIKHPERAFDVYLRGGFDRTHDLVLLGQGEMEDALRCRVAGAGVQDRVHFEGFVQNPYRWMHNAAAMLLTSERESWANVVVEGLIAGARVVSADCDFGPREIMTGELSSFLVPESDINAYVSAVNRAFVSYPRVSSDFIGGFAASAITQQYLAHYRNLFGRGA